MADADVDGAHIATLNLTLFFRYMRPMINAGYVYVAMPPLYRLKWTKGPHDFVYTDAERDRVLAEGKANGPRARTTSCKPTPSATACSPKARQTGARCRRAKASSVTRVWAR